MFSTKNLSGDMFGGLTAAIVALPLALAFGVQSGMGAIAGLYGAITLGILAALFGGTSTQISGPTGPLAVVSAVVIAGEIELYGSLDAAFGTIIATFVLAGLLQILMGVFKIGQYIRYMPYPVISGFMSGIGAIIIIMQIFPFFGLGSPQSIIEVILSIPLIIEHINTQALFLAIATVLIIYLFPLLTKKIPSTLVALVSLTLLASFMDLNVPIIGDIPTGLPELQLAALYNVDWHHPMVMIIPAITLAALGAIDSLLTSVVADNMTKTQHHSNKELIGQGIGNTMSALIGGLPGAGATMRTVVNIKAGGKTKLSGMFHGFILLLILVGAGKYASLIPIPVLAGILITVGVGIIDYKGIKHIKFVPRSDAVVMVIVLILTVFVDLLQAVAVGMVLASVLFMKQMSDTAEAKSTVNTLGDLSKIGPCCPEEKVIIDEIWSQIYIQDFDGPIFFGFISHFKQMMRDLPEVSVVIFRMYSVPNIDQSGMYALEDAILELEKKDITVFITGIQTQPKDMLRNIKLIPNLVPYHHLFPDLPAAVAVLKAHKESLKTTSNKKVIHDILWKR